MKNKKENLILNFLSDDEFSIRDNVFTVNELRHNYLEVNLSHKQMCEKYGISAKTMTSLLTHYHIQKTKELLAVKNIVAKKESRHNKERKLFNKC